ncbi:MAG: hypothetical protein IT443_06950 [Phycisphaeraceae bacterium]|nr:hypothetical protein [Phycisphaeraceae bacterium]
MAESPHELVQRITEQVLAELSARGLLAGKGQRVEIHPPVGVCTGDYSKFAERGDLPGGRTPAKQAPENPVGGSTQQAAPGGGAPGAAGGGEALKGIVTAKQLLAAMAKAADGVARLAGDARLTALAQDLVKEKPGKVVWEGVRSFARQAGGDTGGNTQQAAPCGVAPEAASGGTFGGGGVTSGGWAWWIDGRCPVVEEMTTTHKASLRMIGVNRDPKATAEAIRKLAELVKTKEVVGGLLFVTGAARAMCLANRHPALRAVQGTCVEAVKQGMAEVGANVLVVEYLHVRGEAMIQMVNEMRATAPKVVAALERDLTDLHRGGSR